MSNVFNAVSPGFRGVIVEELKRRNFTLFEELSEAAAPTNAQSDAVVGLLMDALSANYGPGHIPTDYGKILDNAIGAYLMAWANHSTVFDNMTALTLNNFLQEAAGYGACVGLCQNFSSQFVPAGVQLRTIDGADAQTRVGLFDAFGRAWHFPDYFGRNMDAFDDVMRDLDNIVTVDSGNPPASGYLANITNAHLLLRKQLDAFPWFASLPSFYRNYYRDEAEPPAAFAVLLSTPANQLNAVRSRWLNAGVQVPTVTI